jgi:hypothetical protein
MIPCEPATNEAGSSNISEGGGATVTVISRWQIGDLDLRVEMVAE